MDFSALQDTLQGVRSCVSSNASIEGKYTLLSEIGRGSYGVVWRARCNQNSHIFAVKQISKRRAGAKGLCEITGEVETMSLLSHPNIVRLEETFQDADSLWIVMEYLPGGELYQLVKRQEMSEPATRRVVTQLLMAVEYIHDKGIVHRDLKLANCLITGSEDLGVKISDFGFAVLAGADQCLSKYCGTVAFMAPELLLEQNYGKPVDMWALGVMTYYMFTGKYPFTGSTNESLRRAVCRGRCDLNTGRLKLFPLLRDFLSRLLTGDPHRRLTAKEALNHTWVRVGRENNAEASVHYLAPSAERTIAEAAGIAAGGLPRAVGWAVRSARLVTRWRGAILAVVAVHRLLYLHRCSRLSKAGLGHVRMLRDYHYSVTQRFEPSGGPSLDCSRVFARCPQALPELFQMVQTCHSLTALDLSHNNIDNLATVQALLKLCGEHSSLQSLGLAHNPIPAVAGRGLLRLARNPTSRITHIDLTGTFIPLDVAGQIAALLRDKVSSSLGGSTSGLPFPSSPSASSTGGFTLPSTPPPPPRSMHSPRTRAVLGGRRVASVEHTSTHYSDGGVGERRRRAYNSSRLPPLPQAAVVKRVEK